MDNGQWTVDNGEQKIDGLGQAPFIVHCPLSIVNYHHRRINIMIKHKRPVFQLPHVPPVLAKLHTLSPVRLVFGYEPAFHLV
jgi:hypothetical protein